MPHHYTSNWPRACIFLHFLNDNIKTHQMGMNVKNKKLTEFSETISFYYDFILVFIQFKVYHHEFIFLLEQVQYLSRLIFNNL